MRPRFHWGVRIALVYAVFAAATASFVVFAMRQPVELVSDDYYARSLTHDARLAETRAAAARAGTYTIDSTSDGRRVDLRFARGAQIAGTVTFYRPAGAAADRVVPIAVDDAGSQSIDLSGLAPGPWLMQLSWSVNGERCYVERRLVLR